MRERQTDGVKFFTEKKLIKDSYFHVIEIFRIFNVIYFLTTLTTLVAILLNQMKRIIFVLDRSIDQSTRMKPLN